MATATKEAVAEFFPTPTSVISRMLQPVASRLDSSTILEPSAGKGDILDYLVNNRRVSKSNTYAIEINPELQFVLAGKGYRILNNDFLTFSEPYHIDVILMNPPFSDGADHALKAWEIVAPGGVVVCLLNAETLRNPYSEKRKLLKRTIEQHGTVEELGKAFSHAARSTDVDVSMIVLNKPAVDGLGVLDGVKLDTEAPAAETTFSANPLASRNLIQSLVDQYKHIVTLTKQRHDINQQIDFYMGTVRKQYDKKSITSLNEELTEIKKAFWAYVFERTPLSGTTTSKFRDEFEKMQTANSNMAFTAENVMEIYSLLRNNAVDILKKCVMEVFDAITALHEKNKVHTEGWKTNKSWRVNRKIIVPFGVEYDNRWGSWSSRNYKESFFDDLDKACCFLTGQRYDQLSRCSSNGDAPLTGWTVNGAIYSHLHHDKTTAWDDPFDSHFFTIRVYKKGTVHLVFKDEALWKRFNTVAAEGKMWVGAGY